jgi:hypothetical protein
MPLRQLPRRLYKYRLFDVNSLRLLTNAEIYYADPRRFNDPLDCNPTVNVDVERSALEHLCYKLRRDIGLNNDEAAAAINEYRYASTEYGDYKTDHYAAEYLIASLATEIKRLFVVEMGRKGVFSLSETWKSQLMWSHYADEHRGICLEYDTTQIPHPDLAAVDYCSPRSVKASDLIKWKLEASSEAERRVHNTYFFAKAPQWKYEKEWRDLRLASGVTDTSFPITGIYFGLRCDPAVITTIVKLFSGYESIDLFQIYPLDDSFDLKRRRLDQEDLAEIEACGIRSSAILIFKDVILPEKNDENDRSR